jgi:hypothetical protein
MNFISKQSKHVILKGHGNEADFLGFLQKLVPHRSLTLLFEPFRFWLRIRRDIRNRKTTARLAESGSRLLNVSKENLASPRVGDSSTRQVGESLTPQLGELGSFFKFIIKLQHFKRLNRHFKGPI